MVKLEEVGITPGSVDGGFSKGIFLAFMIARRSGVLGRKIIGTKLTQQEREYLPEVVCDSQRQPPHFFTTTVNFPDHNYLLRSVQLDFAYEGCLTPSRQTCKHLTKPKSSPIACSKLTPPSFSFFSSLLRILPTARGSAVNVDLGDWYLINQYEPGEKIDTNSGAYLDVEQLRRYYRVQF